MTRVLITGAAGFVGRWAAKSLRGRGYEVHGIVRNSKPKHPGDSLHTADLLSNEAIEVVKAVRASHLLLTAWVTEHGAYWSSPENEKWQSATLALAEAFLAEGGKRIVFAGTCAEYNWTDRSALSKPLKEGAILGMPHTIYGCSKRETASKLAEAADNAGASFVNGRIFFPVGVGEDRRRFLPNVVTSLLAGKPAKLGNPDLVRDVMDVRDCGGAFAELVATNIEGAVNIGSGKGIELGALAELVAVKLGRPDLLAFRTLPTRVGDPVQLVADTTRLYQEAGFSPRYTLADTVNASIEYWRTQAN